MLLRDKAFIQKLLAYPHTKRPTNTSDF